MYFDIHVQLAIMHYYKWALIVVTRRVLEAIPPRHRDNQVLRSSGVAVVTNVSREGRGSVNNSCHGEVKSFPHRRPNSVLLLCDARLLRKDRRRQCRNDRKDE